MATDDTADAHSGRTSRRARLWAVFCAGCLLLSVSVVPARASAAKPAPAKPVPTQAPYPGAADAGTDADTLLVGGSESPEGEATTAALTCNDFDTHGDTVHLSGGDASGHGWWVNRGCPTTQAVVTIRLQAYYTDGVWRYVGSLGRKTVYSGGGSANRATSRVACVGGGSYGFRSVVDVDLVGLNDSADVGYTPRVNLSCRIA